MPGWIKTVETKSQMIVSDYHITKIWIKETDIGEGGWAVVAEMARTGEVLRMHEGTYDECQRWLKPFYPYTLDSNYPAR